MDIIFLGGLEITTIIGIYDWERETKQTIVLDIEMACDIHKAAQSDAIEDTLDYKSVSKSIISAFSTVSIIDLTVCPGSTNTWLF